ncbi:helix-turn-helix domain-containing protein [Mucilaginibacter lacusdianchii]|uniref:helix-turn-helix domain-containing protein n=1 Tax=Mucilaginibacter lacusdianchii TaxID=2684211 RepID=UPI00131B5C53|nr:helix-turn-helix domain-containing protein [Mucilaginibacter sp. JXJ CY 39]
MLVLSVVMQMTQRIRKFNYQPQCKFASKQLSMKNNNLGSKVKALRISKGYSQEYLAECCRLSLRTIQRIESGATQPHGDSLQRLATCFEIPVHKLTEVAESIRPEFAELPEDRVYLMAIHLSALSFFLWAPLGVIVPFALWVIKRNSIKGIDEIAKRVVNFQITWCLIHYGWLLFFTTSIIFHFNMPVSNIGFGGLGLPEIILIMGIAIPYAYNAIMIVVNTCLAFNGRAAFYQPAIKIFR